MCARPPSTVVCQYSQMSLAHTTLALPIHTLAPHETLAPSASGVGLAGHRPVAHSLSHGIIPTPSHQSTDAGQAKARRGVERPQPPCNLVCWTTRQRAQEATLMARPPFFARHTCTWLPFALGGVCVCVGVNRPIPVLDRVWPLLTQGEPGGPIFVCARARERESERERESVCADHAGLRRAHRILIFLVVSGAGHLCVCVSE